MSRIEQWIFKKYLDIIWEKDKQKDRGPLFINKFSNYLNQLQLDQKEARIQKLSVCVSYTGELTQALELSTPTASQGAQQQKDENGSGTGA